MSSLGVAKGAPIVSAAVAYDDLAGSHILVIHQAVYFEDLTHNLLCPMQVRHGGVEVNDTPKHVLKDPSVKDHAIFFHDGFGITLDLIGVTSFFPTRPLTEDELERVKEPKFDGPNNAAAEKDYYELTAAHPEWDPSSSSFLKTGRLMRMGTFEGLPSRSLF